MNRDAQQKRIDAIDWYHEFDFGDGLVARPKFGDIEAHRRHRRFVEARLGRLDFRGKSVLDVGCWDGYWSFYAERHGAPDVLATDDTSQNWAGDAGLRLARELLKSSINIDTALSVYDLAGLGRRFDIVLCLGVYYHLVDPVHGFAQLRHCCHPSSLLVLEGDATNGIPANTAVYDLSDPAKRKFVPTPHTLATMLEGAYFEVASQVWIDEPRRLGLLRYLSLYRRSTGKVPSRSRTPRTGRLLTIAKPCFGRNAAHSYPPPFGLAVYDERWG